MATDIEAEISRINDSLYEVGQARFPPAAAFDYFLVPILFWIHVHPETVPHSEPPRLLYRSKPPVFDRAPKSSYCSSRQLQHPSLATSFNRPVGQLYELSSVACLSDQRPQRETKDIRWPDPQGTRPRPMGLVRYPFLARERAL